MRIKIFSNGEEWEELEFSSNRKEEILLGRSEIWDVRINDILLSRVQWVIKYDADEEWWKLFDGYRKRQSTNGVWKYDFYFILF